MTTSAPTSRTDVRADLARRVEALLAEHDPAGTDRLDFLDARYAAGLAWVHVAEGHGGLGLPRALQQVVDDALAAAGAPDNAPRRNGIGLGMAAPTILAFGTPEQQERFLRPLWTGREIWCQLFSEPSAGSDLAGVATRAVPDGDSWRVNGQKVWTSSAHLADRALLLARTDPDVPKHRGLTYFALDMRQPGVEVRPLRQITGEAEFNEVFLTDAVVADADRLGEVGAGWQVANATLMSERVAIGSGSAREAGMVGVVADAWRSHPERRTHDAHQRLLRLWVEAEATRMTGMRLAQKLAVGAPGPEGSAMKLSLRAPGPAAVGPRGRAGRRRGPALRRLDAAPPRPGRHDRPRRRLPLPARQGQLHRGRHLRDPAQHHRRARARPARRAPGGQGRRVEGPAPMSDLTLLADDVEDDLRDSLRRLLEPRATRERVAACFDGDDSVAGELWSGLGDLGVTALLVPEGCGGAGASAREAAVVLTELGRHAAPAPYLSSAVVATTALAHLETGGPAGEVLGELAAGAVAALVVPATAHRAGDVAPLALHDDGRLSGAVRSVPGVLGGAPASLLLVPVVEAGSPALRLVRLPADGVDLTAVVGLDMTTPLADVTLDHAPSSALPGDASAAVAEALRVGAALAAADLAGNAAWALETTVAYLGGRRQFGRVVGGYQALKHRLADLYVQVESATAASRYATAAVAEDHPEADVAIAVAKSWCSEVAVLATEEAVQLHGGLGMTWEHPCHLHLKRAKAGALLLGSPASHRDDLAVLVDLPPPHPDQGGSTSWT